MDNGSHPSPTLKNSTIMGGCPENPKNRVIHHPTSFNFLLKIGVRIHHPPIFYIALPIPYSLFAALPIREIVELQVQRGKSVRRKRLGNRAQKEKKSPSQKYPPDQKDCGIAGAKGKNGQPKILPGQTRLGNRAQKEKKSPPQKYLPTEGLGNLTVN